MVEIFKTNIDDKASADKIVIEILEMLSGFRINFDLDDCDKILRVEGEKVFPDDIAEVLRHRGFLCEMLE